MQSEVTFVRDDYVFATSESYPAIGHVSEAENPPLRPRGSNVVSARWVFTWKVDKAGCVIKPKVRLVARGFSQVHTIDFMETYSPTPEALCVKTVVAVAVERDWELRQLDVKQVFFRQIWIMMCI